MSLPIYQTQLRDLSLMQTNWSAQLNPILSNELLNGLLLTSISLSSGNNTINHKLGRKLIGWFIVGINAAATIYDKQSTNNMQDKTLILNSNASCTVNLWVF